MSRPAQIQFLSRFAAAYEPVARLMRFAPLWRAVADVAAPRHGERALDVCTGTGGVAFELARRGAQVVAVDLAAGMLRRARRTGDDRPPPASFLPMDARQLGFASRSFPLVTVSMALHEMGESEREQVLREIARVASDRVVVAEYHVPEDRRRAALFRLTHCFEYLESDAFEPFVRRDFTARLQAAGLAVERPRDIGGYRIWPCRVTV